MHALYFRERAALLAATLIILLFATTHGQNTPVITSLHGTIQEGNTITVSGTYFGDNSEPLYCQYNSQAGIVTAGPAVYQGTTSAHCFLPSIGSNSVGRDGVQVSVHVGCSGVASNLFPANNNAGPSAVPTVTQLQPTTGPPGSIVTIFGSNFGFGWNAPTVSFGGTASLGNVWLYTSTALGCRTPNLASSTAAVTVTVDGSTSGSQTFTMSGVFGKKQYYLTKSGGTSNGITASTTISALEAFPFTIESWLIRNNRDASVPLLKYGKNSDCWTWAWRWQGSDNKIWFFDEANSGTLLASNEKDVSMTWIHSAVSCSSAGVCSIFIDGATSGTSVTLGNLGITGAAARSLALGDVCDGSWGFSDDGIADFRIWNVERDTSAVSNAMYGICSDSTDYTNLAVHWPLTEGTGNPVDTRSSITLSSDLDWIELTSYAVTAVTPSTGSSAGSVTITIDTDATSNDPGKGLSDTASCDISVALGEISCNSVTRVTYSRITCVTSAGETSAAFPMISTAYKSGHTSSHSASAHYTTDGVMPVVQSITPSEGAGGIAITIDGSGFGPSDPTPMVRFLNSANRGAEASGATAWQSQTRLILTAPSAPSYSASFSEVLVEIYGSSSAGPLRTFLYTADQPTVSSLSPNMIDTTGGDTITLDGSNFNAANNKCIFRIDDATAYSEITATTDSATRVRCVAPASATTGAVLLEVLDSTTNHMSCASRSLIYRSAGYETRAGAYLVYENWQHYSIGKIPDNDDVWEWVSSDSYADIEFYIATFSKPDAHSGTAQAMRFTNDPGNFQLLMYKVTGDLWYDYSIEAATITNNGESTDGFRNGLAARFLDIDNFFYVSNRNSKRRVLFGRTGGGFHSTGYDDNNGEDPEKVITIHWTFEGLVQNQWQSTSLGSDPVHFISNFDFSGNANLNMLTRGRVGLYTQDSSDGFNLYIIVKPLKHFLYQTHNKYYPDLTYTNSKVSYDTGNDGAAAASTVMADSRGSTNSYPWRAWTDIEGKSMKFKTEEKTDGKNVLHGNEISLMKWEDKSKNTAGSTGVRYTGSLSALYDNMRVSAAMAWESYDANEKAGVMLRNYEGASSVFDGDGTSKFYAYLWNPGGNMDYLYKVDLSATSPFDSSNVLGSRSKTYAAADYDKIYHDVNISYCSGRVRGSVEDRKRTDSVLYQTTSADIWPKSASSDLLTWGLVMQSDGDNKDSKGRTSLWLAAPCVNLEDFERSPTSGTVTITGAGFDNGGGTWNTVVYFQRDGGTITSCPSITTVSDTQITCVPVSGSRTGGSYSWWVGVGGTISDPKEYWSYKAPTISSAAGASVKFDAGGTVTITGSNFGQTGDPSPSCSFGPVTPLSCNRISDTQITMQVPTHTGAVPVINIGVTVDTLFNEPNTLGKYTTVTQPVITAIAPNAPYNAAGGETVTFSGTDFSEGTANSPYTATINGVDCTTTTYVSITEATCVVPSGTGLGLGIVISDGSARVSSAKYLFSYHAPTVSAAPLTNTAGDTIIVTGSNFGPTSTVVSGVTVGGNACANPSVLSDTTIQCDAPAGVGTGHALIVTISGQTSASGVTVFSYKAPTVSSLSHTWWFTDGGKFLTVTGTQFGPTLVDSISIGGNACTNTTFISDTLAGCNVPPGTAGAASVLVTSGSQTSAVNTLFTYGTRTRSTGGYLYAYYHENHAPASDFTFGSALDSWTLDAGSATYHTGGYVTVGVSARLYYGDSSAEYWYDYIFEAALKNQDTDTSCRWGMISRFLPSDNMMVLFQIKPGTVDPTEFRLMRCWNNCGSTTQTTGWHSYGSALGSEYKPLNLATCGDTVSGWLGHVNYWDTVHNSFVINWGYPNYYHRGTIGVVASNKCSATYLRYVRVKPCAHYFYETWQNAAVGTPGLGAYTYSSGWYNGGTWLSDSTYAQVNADKNFYGYDNQNGNHYVTLGNSTSSLGLHSARFSFSAGHSNWKNYKVSASIAWQDDTTAGLALRLQSDDASYYGIGLTKATGVSGFKYDGVMSTDMTSGWTTSAPTLNTEWSDVDITLAAEMVVIDHRGINVAKGYVDTLFSSGSIGVFSDSGSANSGNVYFDDIFVSPAPIIHSFLNPLIDTDGSATLTIVGEGFYNNADQTGNSFFAYYGWIDSTYTTSCTTTTYVSDTVVTCQVPAGTGASKEMMIGIGGCDTEPSIPKWSYRVPTISTVTEMGANAVQTVTIAGKNFGPGDSTPSATIDGTACSTPFYISDTQFRCLYPNKGLGTYDVIVTVDSQVSATASIGVYTAIVVITATTPTMIPTLADNTYEVTILGTSFGATSPGGFFSASINNVTCSTVTWVSDSETRCVGTPTGSGGNIEVALTAESGDVRKSTHFSYKAPTVSSALPIVGTDGPHSVTISGDNFGPTSTVVSVLVDGTWDCSPATVTAAHNEIVCASPDGQGIALPVQITANSVVGADYNLWTFKGPTINSVWRAETDNYGSYISVIGENFGTTTNANTNVNFVGIGDGTNERPNGHTAIRVRAPEGSGTGHDLIVTLDGQISATASGVFSYKTPTIDSVTIPTSTTGSTVTIDGKNLGATGATYGVLLGTQACGSTAYVTWTRITCLTLSGHGGSYAVTVTVTGQEGSLATAFSYKQPTITAATRGSTTGTSVVTLSGSNFGSSEASLSGSIDENACQSVLWVSHFAATCTVDLTGSGSSKNATITSSSLTSDIVDIFSYKIPTITAVTRPPTDGGIITIDGSNFGPSAIERNILLFGTQNCTNPAYSSHTRLTCDAPAGQGAGLAIGVTADSLHGSQVNLFSYEAAVIYSVTQAPTAGGGTVSITGNNFGLSTATISVDVNGNTCSSVTWYNNTAVTCVVSSPGAGGNLPIYAVVQGEAGATVNVFSYKVPTITAAIGLADADGTSSVITLDGSNFGPTGTTFAGSINDTVSITGDCASVIWVSDTQVKCDMQTPGSGKDIYIILTSAGQASNGTNAPYFSYKAPSITSVSPDTASTSGSDYVTISGKNFGNGVYAPVALIQSNACDSTLILSDTQVQCQVNGYTGVNKEIEVTVKGQTGTLAGIFSYKAPTVTALTPDRTFTNGTGTVTILGSNFGRISASGARLGNVVGASCTTTSYLSDTQLACQVVAGTGGLHDVFVSIDTQVSATVADLYTYLSPTVGTLLPNNVPMEGGTITVYGTNFGTSDQTPSATIDWVPMAVPAVWISDTFLKVVVTQQGPSNPLSGGLVSALGGELRVRVDTLDSGDGFLMYYNAPVISSISGASTDVTAGGAIMTVHGSNFGTYDSGVVASVNGTACTTTTWTSDTLLTCLIPPGIGAWLYVSVTVDTLDGASPSAVFTYKRPTIDVQTLAKLSTIGQESITVQGSNFGQVSAGQALLYGSIGLCNSTNYISDTQLVCVTQTGSGAAHDVQATVSNQISDVTSTEFSYKDPTITSMTPDRGGNEDYDTVTIFGSNFATSDLSQVASIDGVACGVTQWVNDFSVLCRIPAGTGLAKTALVTVSSLVSSSSNEFFSYKDPTISEVTQLGNTDGTGIVTVTGTNFGTYNVSQNVTIHESACIFPTLISDKQISCQVPVGSGKDVNVFVTVHNQYSTGGEGVFSYKIPTITAMSPDLGPTVGGQQVTLSGNNFGPSYAMLNGSVDGANFTTVLSHDHVSAVAISPPGTGKELDALIQTSGQWSTSSAGNKLYSYKVPTISSIPDRGHTDGSSIVSINGINFGTTNVSQDAFMWDMACQNVTHVSDVLLLCQNPQGYGFNRNANVSVTGQWSIGGDSVFSYAQPTVLSYLPLTTYTTGGYNISIIGTNFGMVDVYDRNLTILHSEVPCRDGHYYISNTAMLCANIPAGIDALHDVVVTVGGLVSDYGVFNYSYPEVHDMTVKYSATGGGALINITGVNFGTTEVGQSGYLGAFACAPFEYLSDYSVSCVIPPGMGDDLPVLIHVGNQVANGSAKFSYARPTVSSVSPDVEKGSGGFQFTILGNNFGTFTYDQTVTIDVFPCTPIYSISNTQITCLGPSGAGQQRSVEVTANSAVNDANTLFSYDPAEVTAMSPAYGPAAGGYNVTIYGLNFGPSTLYIYGKIGTRSCIDTVHFDDTSYSCMVPAGTGSGIIVTSTISTFIREKRMFSYEAPTVTAINPTILSTGGTETMTMFGSNFGPESANVEKVHVDGVDCQSYTYVSDSIVTCHVPPGVGQSLTCGVIVSKLRSADVSIFSYKGPTVTSVSPAEATTLGGTLVTFYGEQFGPGDATQFGTLAHIYKEGGADSNGLRIKWYVELEGQSGSQYNGYKVVLNRNSWGLQGAMYLRYYGTPEFFQLYTEYTGTAGTYPDDGTFSGLVTYSGTETHLSRDNTGYLAQYSDVTTVASTSVGYTACAETIYISASEAVCQLPAGEGGGLATQVTTGGTSSPSSATLFSYYSPIVTSVTPTTGSLSGGFTVSIEGQYFGATTTLPEVTLGEYSCSLISRVSDTRVTCSAPSGSGGNHNATVNLAGRVGYLLQAFSYNQPAIASFSPANGGTAGGDSVTVLGSDFGLTQPASLDITVGGSPCTSSSWVSNSQLICVTPTGSNLNQFLRVYVSGFEATQPPGPVGEPTGQYFGYDKPEVHYTLPAGGSATGGFNITIVGLNFGVTDILQSIFIESTNCTNALWVNNTHAICGVPAGSGFSQKIYVTSGNQTNDDGGVFSYLPPAITAVVPDTAGTAGGDTITINGYGFGAIASNQLVQINSRDCTTNTYVSDNQMLCVVPTGMGSGLSVNSVLDGVSSSTNALFTYKAPTVTSLTPSSGPTYNRGGGGTVTLSGKNFGTHADATTLGLIVYIDAISKIQCTSPLVLDDSLIRCAIPQDVFEGSDARQIFVQVGSQISDNTSVPLFSYTAPVVQVVIPSTVSTTGGTITIRGYGFGQNADYGHLNVTVGGLQCPSLTYIDDNELQCGLNAGLGGSLEVKVTSQNATSGMPSNLGASFINYAAPTISSFTPTSVISAASTLTLTGLAFGPSSDPSLDVAIGTQSCSTTSYVSDTVLECVVPSGVGTGLALSVTVGGQSAALATPLASYAAPVISSVTNAGTNYDEGGYSITIDGTGFGTSSDGVLVTVGGLACNGDPIPTSSTRIVCFAPSGTGAATVAVTVANEVATSTLTYSGTSYTTGEGCLLPPITIYVNESTTAGDLVSAIGDVQRIYSGSGSSIAQVTYSVTSGSAIGGTDYQDPGSVVLSWAAADSASKQVNVSIISDAVVDSTTREFYVDFTSPVAASLCAHTRTTVIIQDTPSVVAVGTVNAGWTHGAHQAYSTGNLLKAHWYGFTNAIRFYVGIGTSNTTTDVQAMSRVGFYPGNPSVYSGSSVWEFLWNAYLVEHRQTYYFHVLAVSATGHEQTVVSSGIFFDQTPPSPHPGGVSVYDGSTLGTDLSQQVSLSSWCGTWDSWYDWDSNITAFHIGLGTSPLADDISAFTAVASSASELASGSGSSCISIALSEGVKYYFSVKAFNRAGGSFAASSDGVVSDSTAPVAGTVSTSTVQVSTDEVLHVGPLASGYHLWYEGYTHSVAMWQRVSSTVGTIETFADGTAWSLGDNIGGSAAYIDSVHCLGGSNSTSIIHLSTFPTLYNYPNVRAMLRQGSLCNNPGAILNAPVNHYIPVNPYPYLNITWTGFDDPDTSFSIDFAIGTTAGSEDILSYASSSPYIDSSSLFAIYPAVFLSTGTEVHITVRITNAGGQSAVAASTYTLVCSGAFDLEQKLLSGCIG